jgi:hypothetical protein
MEHVLFHLVGGHQTTVTKENGLMDKPVEIVPPVLKDNGSPRPVSQIPT